MNGQWVNRACKSTGLKTAGTFHIDWVRSCTRGAKYRTWSWTYIEGGDPATVTLVSHTATCYG
jgi:hypothetical protein